MLKQILVPTDGSELSSKAIEGAVDVAKQLGAKLIGLTVTEPYPYAPLTEYAPTESYEHYEARVKHEAAKRLSFLQSAAESAGVPVEIEVRSALNPYDAIIATAMERDCDTIFMASHGRRGLSGMLLGSETNKVLTHSTIPVLVFR